MADHMTIGEFAARCGLSAKVLRTYAEVGVLAPSAVDPASGYRYYDAGQLAEAATVVFLRRAGIPLADIARFLAGPSAEQLDGWERSLRAEVHARRDALAEVRARLGLGTAHTRGVTMVEIRPVGDRAELGNVFDLLGAQGTPGLDTSDFRFADLDAHFPHDQPLMLIASTEGQPVGGALAFRNDHGVVVLRVIAVIDARHLAHVGGGVVVPARSEGNKGRSPPSPPGERRCGSRKIGPGQAPTPVFASPLDRQAVEVGVGDQAPIRAPPAVDMNGGDRLGVLSCGNTNVHGPRMTDVERRPARYFGL